MTGKHWFKPKLGLGARSANRKERLARAVFVALAAAWAELTGKHWFKNKPIGLGAWPANWKGWLALAVFLALAVAWAEATMVGADLTAWDYVVSFAGFAAILGVYTWLKIKKSDGPWRWRWGNE